MFTTSPGKKILQEKNIFSCFADFEKRENSGEDSCRIISLFCVCVLLQQENLLEKLKPWNFGGEGKPRNLYLFSYDKHKQTRRGPGSDFLGDDLYILCHKIFFSRQKIQEAGSGEMERLLQENSGFCFKTARLSMALLFLSLCFA